MTMSTGQIVICVLIAFVVVCVMCLRWLLRDMPRAGIDCSHEPGCSQFVRDREWAIRHMEQGPSEPLPHAANESIMRKAQQNQNRLMAP